MKRVSKILLLGVLLLFSAAVVASAQEAVSLTGVNASLVGDSVVIEIQTTRSGDFELERADGDSWVFLWCDGFVLDTSMGNVPVDFGIAAFDGLVEGAALAASGKKSGISISLGSNADMDRAFVVNGENSSTITIPSISGLSSDSSRGSPVEDNGFEIPSVLSRGIEVPLGSSHVEEVEQPEDTPPEPSVQPRESLGTSEFQAPRIDWGVDGGSQFSMPGVSPAKLESTDVVSIEPAEPGFRDFIPDQYDPVPTFEANPPSGSSVSTSSGLSQDAEINYQSIPQSAPEETPGSDQPELGDAIEQLAEELLKNAFDTGSEQSTGNTIEGTFSTPDGNLNSQYKSQALLSDNGHIERGLTKNDLMNIRIDLFEIVDTALDQAITLLVAPTDFNVIVDADVGTNKISLSFKDKQTNLKSALDLITKVYGLQYVVEASTIVVASKEKMAVGLLAAEPRMFVLSFADPVSVKNILINTGLVPETNVEVYTGESEYQEVNDSTHLSTESESSVHEVKLIETNMSSSPRNVLLVTAAPEEMLVIAKVIKDLDRKPKLIELEVRVCEASENALRDLGIEINNNQSTPTPTVTVFREPIQTDLSGNYVNESDAINSFSRSPLNMVATLNTLVADGTVEVLAQPTLTTVEGKQAIYFAGERIPYIAKVSQTTSGTQIEVDFLNVGITLNFKPRLDADGKLTIDVNPIVSSLLEFRIIGDLIEAPRTSSRQMATTVRVGSNEPFVLAGLISETERTTITKVPLLGDLPLVGKLFRNKNHRGERTEIIVVVTPVVKE